MKQREPSIEARMIFELAKQDKWGSVLIFAEQQFARQMTDLQKSITTSSRKPQASSLPPKGAR